MKQALIKRVQRWVETASAGAIANVSGRLYPLSQRADVLVERLELLREEQRLAAQIALNERWRQDPNRLDDRAELPHWLNFLGLFGEGVEIGVFRGEFSRLLLQAWKGQRLHSVDPWRSFDPEVFVDSCNVSDDIHQQRYELTCQRLQTYGERSNIVRKTSEEAARDFKDGSLDFVYIDAQHHYEAVVEDIALWLPKIKQGGVIGGHDYLDGMVGASKYGVKQAADEFVQREGKSLIRTTTDGRYPSWFVRL